MADGPTHYREAELLLTHTVASVTDRFGEGAECARQQIAMAQVHAILANAAASAMNIRRNGAVEDVDGPSAWERVLGASE